MALADIPKQADADTTCPKCGHRFNYAEQPEVRMGCVACPACKADVGQDSCDANKGKSNASTTDEGAKGDASGADGASGQPAVFGPADIEAAKAHGFTSGKEAADDKLLVRARAGEERVIALTVDLKRVQGLLDASVAESRKLQGERDQARAAVEKHKAALDEANGKLAKLLAGGLTFQPAVETWADALKAAGGDYEKARKQFPEAYRVQREHDKQNRQ